VDMVLLRGLALLILIAAFVALCFWAWSKKRKADFERLSRLPLEEDDGEIPGSENREHN